MEYYIIESKLIRSGSRRVFRIVTLVAEDEKSAKNLGSISTPSTPNVTKEKEPGAHFEPHPDVIARIAEAERMPHLYGECLAFNHDRSITGLECSCYRGKRIAALTKARDKLAKK